MCKYCDETLYRFEHKRFVTKEEMYEPIDKNFCAHCGTPLGEVKPLTVEQIKLMRGKPIWFVSLEDDGFSRWDVIMQITKWSMETAIGENVTFENYATTWICFDRQPKGEAE